MQIYMYFLLKTRVNWHLGFFTCPHHITGTTPLRHYMPKNFNSNGIHGFERKNKSTVHEHPHIVMSF